MKSFTFISFGNRTIQRYRNGKSDEKKETFQAKTNMVDIFVYSFRFEYQCYGESLFTLSSWNEQRRTKRIHTEFKAKALRRKFRMNNAIPQQQ